MVRKFHVQLWKLQGRRFYVCHVAHENDRVATTILSEYFKRLGVGFRVIEFGANGNRPELKECLDHQTIAIIGYNQQLDNSWIGEENFITAAGKKNIRVIQLILDHPSLRWPGFTNNPAARNVRYTLVSDHCQRYFHRYCLPTARTAVTNAPFFPGERVHSFTRNSFLDRNISCLIPLNLRRLGGTQQEVEVRIGMVDQELQQAIREAIENARFDLANPREVHLEKALARRSREISNELMHVCTGMVEDMTHIWRRRRVFEIAARFPVLIQTDLPPPELLANAVASFRNTPEWTNPNATLARYRQCRSVLSVSMTNDALHDRTGGALNAGCVPIVEDNVVHRRLFKPDRSAFFFRYDDDSLERCLNIVCNAPERAYPIARAAMRLRDKPSMRYAGLDNMLDLAIN